MIDNSQPDQPSLPAKPFKPKANVGFVEIKPAPMVVAYTDQVPPSIPAMHCAARHSIQTCEHFAGKPRFLIFSPLAWHFAIEEYRAERTESMPPVPTSYDGIKVAVNRQFPGIIVVAIG